MNLYGTPSGHFARWFPAYNPTGTEIPSYGIVTGSWATSVSNGVGEVHVAATSGASTPVALKAFVNSATPIPALQRGIVSHSWPLRVRSQVRTAGQYVHHLAGTFELGQAGGIYANWFLEFLVLADFGDGATALVIPRGYLPEVL